MVDIGLRMYGTQIFEFFQFVFIATKGGSETGYIAVDQLEFKQTDECIFQVGY